MRFGFFSLCCFFFRFNTFSYDFNKQARIAVFFFLPLAVAHTDNDDQRSITDTTQQNFGSQIVERKRDRDCVTPTSHPQHHHHHERTDKRSHWVCVVQKNLISEVVSFTLSIFMYFFFLNLFFHFISFNFP